MLLEIISRIYFLYMALVCRRRVFAKLQQTYAYMDKHEYRKTTANLCPLVVPCNNHKQIYLLCTGHQINCIILFIALYILFARKYFTSNIKCKNLLRLFLTFRILSILSIFLIQNQGIVSSKKLKTNLRVLIQFNVVSKRTSKQTCKRASDIQTI